MQDGATRFIPNRAHTLTDVFEERLGKNCLLNVQKYAVAKAKWQGNKKFELSIDEIKSFFSLFIICRMIKGRDEPLYRFWENSYGRKTFSETMVRNKF